MTQLITGLVVIIMCAGCAAGQNTLQPYQSLTCHTLKVDGTWQTQCW
jgi:hypothetical protein